MTDVAAAQASKTYNAGSRPKNGAAYPFLKQNERNRKDQYDRHREGNQEQHYKNFLYQIELHCERQCREEQNRKDDPRPDPPSLVSGAILIASV